LRLSLIYEPPPTPSLCQKLGLGWRRLAMKLEKVPSCKTGVNGVRLNEKGGTHHEMPYHHNLEIYIQNISNQTA
jgi:hypothetical protein